MRAPSANAKFLDLVLVIFVAAAFLFASPVHLLWMTPEAPWYVPYLIWLGVIVVTGVVHHRRHRDEL